MKNLHRSWYLLVLLLGLSVASHADLIDIKRVAHEGHQQSGAPGMSVAVVLDGQLAWSQGFGVADLEHGAPARADTLYRIASISKPIAATAVMQLVERDRIQLDAPLQQYLASFPQKGEQTITVRHLLTHTSGIRHYRGREMQNRERYQTNASSLVIFQDDPLLFPPGTKYGYTTYGYNVLAGVVESASGTTFESYLRENIWVPAAMTATCLDQVDAVIPRRSRQYVRQESQLLNAPYVDLSNKWAGGGILSSVEDLARFHIALDQGKLLKPETLQQMYSPHKLSDGTATNYGFGWTISKDESQRVWIAHSGGATGGTTYLLRDPSRHLAVAILCNLEGVKGLRDLALRIAHAATTTATPSE